MTLTCDAARDQAAGFALGALDPTEERDVREHLATCHELHEEFAVLGGVAQYLDETVELVEPPSSLRDRVLAAVAAARQGDAAQPVAPVSRRVDTIDVARATTAPLGDAPATPPIPADVAPAAGAVPAPPPRVDRTKREAQPSVPAARRSRGSWLFAAAAVILIVALGGWNLYLQYQMGSSSSFESAMNDVLAMAARPGSMTAVLSAGGGSGPRGIAAVTDDGSIALAIRDLQPTVGTQVYETWMIPPNGSPVAVGNFRVGSSGIAAMTTHVTAHAAGMTIALTREPAPGATTPTMPVISSGVAAAPPSS